MNLDATNQYILVALIGLTLILVGGINIALRSTVVWKRFTASLLTILTTNGLAWAVFPESTLIKIPLFTMLGSLPVLYVLLSQKVRTFAINMATHPMTVWGLVTTAGLTVAGYGMYKLDEIDEQQLITGDELLAMTRKPELQKVPDQLAWTDTGKPITVLTGEFEAEMNRQEAENHTLVSIGAWEKVIRREAADEHSNCHGWVFTGGQYWLDGESVELILQENGYKPVNQPLPGDIVIYRDTDNRITHTALVRSAGLGMPAIVEGKSGWMVVFLHLVDESPYGKNYTFYRSKRKGHLVVGLGNQKEASPATPAANDDNVDHRNIRRY